MPVCFTKPHFDIPQQLKLLQDRGMTISDPQKAGQYLERIGYYRLSGYWYPFRQSQVRDVFCAGAEFGHAVRLYVFDKKLRLLFLDAIERIEVGIRVRIALLLGSRDPWAHREPSQLHGNFAKKINPRTNRTFHQDWLQRLDNATCRSKEDFVQHFRSKYSSPLPIWIAIELWDFGLLSTFLSGMARNDRQTIADYYCVPREQLLCSWVRSINHVRNICAHHSRLWNRSLVDQPKPPRNDEIPLLDHLVGNTRAQSRLYAVAAVMQFLLRTINPTTSWDARLKQHLATFPGNVSGITVHQMGFTESWEHLALWE